MKTEKEALERARKLELEPEPVTDLRALQKETLDEAEALRKLLKPTRFIDGKRTTLPTSMRRLSSGKPAESKASSK